MNSVARSCSRSFSVMQLSMSTYPSWRSFRQGSTVHVVEIVKESVENVTGKVLCGIPGHSGGLWIHGASEKWIGMTKGYGLEYSLRKGLESAIYYIHQCLQRPFIALSTVFANNARISEGNNADRMRGRKNSRKKT
jgi:hypothetical protein